jgi:hypothetical protein
MAAMAALFPWAFVDNFDPRLVVAHVCVEPLECLLHSVVVGGGPLGSLIAFVFWESGLLSEFCLLGKCYRLTYCCVGALVLLQVAGAHPLMMSWWMMLRVIVCQVVTAFLPADFELILCHAVADPVEAHVYGFGSLLFDCVVGDSSGTFIICYHDGWRLCVA